MECKYLTNNQWYTCPPKCGASAGSYCNGNTVTPCPQGSFCPSAQMKYTVPCSRCVDGSTYASSVCTATSNAVCSQCSSCQNTSFQLSACNSTSDTVCLNCTAQCGLGWFKSAACSNRSDLQCTPCPSNEHYCNGSSTIYNCSTQRPSETYVVKACTNATDTVFAPCTPVCSPGTFETMPCTNTTNRVCSKCLNESYCLGNRSIANCTKPCSTGEYEVSPCNATTNRVCAPCSDGHFCTDTVSMVPCYSTHCANGACWSTCGLGELTRMHMGGVVKGMVVWLGFIKYKTHISPHQT